MIEEHTLPEQIIFTRKTLSGQQETFAEHFGVTQATISRWESGIAKPSGPAMVILKKLIEKAKRKAGQI